MYKSNRCDLAFAIPLNTFGDYENSVSLLIVENKGKLSLSRHDKKSKTTT